jgi:hypothetical protein
MIVHDTDVLYKSKWTILQRLKSKERCGSVSHQAQQTWPYKSFRKRKLQTIMQSPVHFGMVQSLHTKNIAEWKIKIENEVVLIFLTTHVRKYAMVEHRLLSFHPLCGNICLASTAPT